MPTGDTIAAVATGLARSPLAIIRVSGPDVPEIARSALGISTFERCVTPARLTIGQLSLEVTGLLSPGPASFTGEDVLEIVLPGNPLLCERVIMALGVRPAGPGEFSARAHLNGRLSLLEAEGVASLITAETATDLAHAESLLSGAQGATYRGWTDRLAQLLALVEAGIDFADQEDVVAIETDDLIRGCQSLIADLEADLGARRGTESGSDFPVVAIVGSPSAGKSTLFNALLGMHRSVVHASHHTTRDVIREPLDLSGVAPGVGSVELLDLPGLDDTIDPPEHVLEQVASADLRVWCDPMGRFRGEFPAPCVRVRTMADKPVAGTSGDVSVCALDGYRLDSLRRAIADHAFTGAARAVPARHRAAFAGAIPALHRAVELAQLEPEAELIASALREALDALASLTGEVTPDDVIGRVFASFCVGK